MLRITAVPEGSSRVTLKVEGRIVADWVEVLERECNSWLQQGFRVSLDLTHVGYIDGLGVEKLKSMSDEVRIERCPLLIAEFLKGEDSQ